MPVSSRNIRYIAWAALLLAGCRLHKPVTAPDASPSGKAAYTSCYPMESITVSKCRWSISEGGRTHQLNGKIHIRPDSICYFLGTTAMGIEVFRGVVREDSFAMINRPERICYRGSNAYLSRMTGCPVNPRMLYLLFTADCCTQAYRAMGFSVTERDGRMVIYGKNANSLEFSVDTEHRTVESVSVQGQGSAPHGFGIAYRQYRSFPLFALPSVLDISARSNAGTIGVNAVLQEITFDSKQKVNFRIPEQYKTVWLK
ncbi:MAG: DUF4292 domain-containing protein [Bacteroidales bacterium]|jgi:hypothetical protein|nr:DUF4292 domain-containing protein [Bacteroidales bacterium]